MDSRMPLFQVPIIVTKKNDVPCLELRKTTQKSDSIQVIVRAAIDDIPVVVQPVFTDKIRALHNLVEKGIIYMGKDLKYYFNF